MSKILHAVVGVFAAVGFVFTAASMASLIYANKKLYDMSNNYKYGPARHLAYYSDIIHRTSRGIDSAAVSMFHNASSEDQLKYDRMIDEHDAHTHHVR
jgi:ABC-type transport system involved in multi-copper enzyme maturation permease subunit